MYITDLHHHMLGFINFDVREKSNAPLKGCSGGPNTFRFLLFEDVYIPQIELYMYAYCFFLLPPTWTQRRPPHGRPPRRSAEGLTR